MTSGFSSITRLPSWIRPAAPWERESSASTSSPPAISTSSLTQRMPLIIGSSHSSKYTLGRCLAAAFRISRRFFSKEATSRSPFSGTPTIEASICTMSRISWTERWLKITTFRPAFTRSLEMSACKSEKPSTRSGLSARIFPVFALRKAETRGFSCRARGGRTV